MDDPIIYVPAVLAVIGTVILFALILTSGTRKKIRTVQAQVLTKKIKRAYVHKLARVGVSGADWLEYYAVFKLEKGTTIELQLPKEIYDSIEENDKGQLTFNDYKFISFDKNSCYFVHSSQ